MCPWNCSITICNSWLNTLAESSANKILLCCVHSPLSMSDCGPGILTLMVQSSNSCDTMSSGAQLELQLHWQSSVEMDSRDDDGEFCQRAEDMGLGLKSLNTLDCSVEWSLLELVFKVFHWRNPLALQLYSCTNSIGWNPAELHLLLSTQTLPRTKGFNASCLLKPARAKPSVEPCKADFTTSSFLHGT